MPEYTHTLIPERVDFVPEPEQVAAFLASLVSIGAAPLEPEISVRKLSGPVRSFANPLTGKTDFYQMRKPQKVEHLTAIQGALSRLDDYNLTVVGKGPPRLPPLALGYKGLEFKGNYAYDVNCCLRPEVVSTSDWHDPVPVQQKVEFFGQPCSPDDRLGVFHNPNTLEVIEVPNAGCARFWIEFEFGKMLFPRIEHSLDLIEPTIVQAAVQDFGIKFIQGCQWGA